MLIQLSPSIAELTVSSGHEKLSLRKGEKVQLYGDLLMRLLKEGRIVKAEYSEIKNDEVITIVHSNDRGWRPIGKEGKRP